MWTRGFARFLPSQATQGERIHDVKRVACCPHAGGTRASCLHLAGGERVSHESRFVHLLVVSGGFVCPSQRRRGCGCVSRHQRLLLGGWKPLRRRVGGGALGCG